METQQFYALHSNKELDSGSDIPGMKTKILEILQNERKFPEDNPIDSEKNNTNGWTQYIQDTKDKEV